VPPPAHPTPAADESGLQVKICDARTSASKNLEALLWPLPILASQLGSYRNAQ